ncbi:MAG TPA: hypothetical protein V6D07_18950 [Trichocoleus sp.]
MISSVWLSKLIAGEGHQFAPIPVYGYPETLSLEGDKLICSFPEHRAIASIALDNDFSVGSDQPVMRLLSTRINSQGEGVLKVSGSSAPYYCKEMSADSRGCLIFVRQSNTDGVPLTLINPSDSITAVNECKILEGGRVKTSPSLAGSTVQARIPVYLNSTITVIVPAVPIPPRSLQLHALGEVEGGTSNLLTFQNCTAVDHYASGGVYKLTFSYEGVEEEALV